MWNKKHQEQKLSVPKNEFWKIIKGNTVFGIQKFFEIQDFCASFVVFDLFGKNDGLERSGLLKLVEFESYHNW